MQSNLASIEVEVVFLKATIELIDSMVNHAMLSVRGVSPDATVLFETSVHQKFFNIQLVDFLSETDPSKDALVPSKSYMDALCRICENPKFCVNNSVANLKSGVKIFDEWLNKKIVRKIWFGSISLETQIELSHAEYTKICGNISKHNMLRSVRVAKQLKTILRRSEAEIDIETSMLALPDFYEWFHTDVLSYHSSEIVELLNNIRWGIYEYLQPELQESLVWESNDARVPMYKFTYPENVVSTLGKQFYWDLMNAIRSPPFFPKFEVTRSLKLRY